jgi:hypothetical protein
MKTKFTINLGGNMVTFTVHRTYEAGSDFSVTHDDEVICDGYQSGGRFYFLSMSKKVEFFQEIFEAKVIESLKELFKTKKSFIYKIINNYVSPIIGTSDSLSQKTFTRTVSNNSNAYSEFEEKARKFFGGYEVKFNHPGKIIILS